MASVPIPFGYYVIDVRVIPRISHHRPISIGQVAVGHLYIQSDISLCLSSPFVQTTLLPGQYFIWNPHMEKWKVLPIKDVPSFKPWPFRRKEGMASGVPPYNCISAQCIPYTLLEENIKIWDSCEIPEIYSFLSHFPYVQLGDLGIYYYNGTTVNSPVYWEDQIQYPQWSLPYMQPDVLRKTSFIHMPAQLAKRMTSDPYLKRTIDMMVMPSIGMPSIGMSSTVMPSIPFKKDNDPKDANDNYSDKDAILRVEYRASVIKYIDTHCKTKYSISISEATHDITTGAWPFCEYVHHIQKENPCRRPPIPGIHFCKLGDYALHEEQYYDMIWKNRGW